jgi:hypothetical protein
MSDCRCPTPGGVSPDPPQCPKSASPRFVPFRLAFYRRCRIFQAMLRPAPYLSQKLTRPLHIKDGGTLRTVLDARACMIDHVGASSDLSHQKWAPL